MLANCLPLQEHSSNMSHNKSLKLPAPT